MKKANLIEYQSPSTLIVNIALKRTVLSASTQSTLEGFDSEENLYD